MAVGGDYTNPSYYKQECSLECIEAMEIGFGTEAVFYFCVCNAYKYLWRHKNKNGEKDLHKAMWYVDRARNELGKVSIIYNRHKHEETLTTLSNYIQEYLKGESNE